MMKEITDVLVQKVTEAAGHVIQDQLDTITHLATTTLSDVTSSQEPPSSDGRP